MIHQIPRADRAVVGGHDAGTGRWPAVGSARGIGPLVAGHTVEVTVEGIGLPGSPVTEA